MRGKAVLDSYTIGVPGITPAYAGKRNKVITPEENQQDHPRLCGEKGSFLRLRQHLSGSPPPMRGKEQWAKAAGIRAGITPAYAGKRLTLHKIWQTVRDHPRLCGEKQNFSR